MARGLLTQDRDWLWMRRAPRGHFHRGIPMTANDSSSDSGQAIQLQPMPAGTAVLDVDASLKRLGGDRNILVELAKMFAEDSPGLMGAIEEGIQQSRFSDAGRAAHSLRGLAANFGA